MCSHFALASWLLLPLAVRAAATGCADGKGGCEAPTPRNGSFFLQVRQGKAARQAAASGGAAGTYKVKVTPQSVMTCEAGEAVMQTPTMTRDGYQRIVVKFWAEMDLLKKGEDRATKDTRLAHFGGCVLRMCGHDFMDFIDGVGGNDACTDMDEPDNAGLMACLREGQEEYGDSDLSMYRIYQDFCTEVSLADFIVIAAQAVMAHLSGPNGMAMRRGFKNGFKFGRITRDADCVMPHHILPNPDNSCNDVERVFVNNMGLSWRSATALMSVHSIGAASVDNSGFDGFWDTLHHSAKFNNHYYVNLLATSWCPEQVAATGRWQWRRCEQLEADQTDEVKNQMMLNTDMCLAFTAPNGVDVLSAKDTPCCSWVHTGLEEYPMGDVIRNNDNLEFCGKPCPANAEPGTNEQCNSPPKETEMCCAGDASFSRGAKGALDCGTPGLGRDPGHDRQGSGLLTDSNQAVLDFASSNEVWMEEFLGAWFAATENGATDLSPLLE